MSGVLTSVHDGRIMIDDGCDSIDIAVSDWAELKATIDKKIKADDEKLSSDCRASDDVSDKNVGIIAVEDGNIAFKNFTISGIVFARQDNGDVLLRIVTDDIRREILDGCQKICHMD